MDASHQHDEFFQAILDEPDNLVPRLIYADWLDERGDPRGEFIRVQCELAEIPETHARRRALLTRQYELLHRHKHVWNGEVFRASAHTPLKERINRRKGSVRRWGFRRGFVEFLSVDSEAFLKYSESLFHVGPLRALQIRIRRQEVDGLLNHPRLMQLRELELHTGVGWPDMARRIVEHPAVRRLDSLGITNSSGAYSPETAAIFESAPNLSQETRDRWARERSRWRRAHAESDAELPF